MSSWTNETWTMKSTHRIHTAQHSPNVLSIVWHSWSRRIHPFIHSIHWRKMLSLHLRAHLYCQSFHFGILGNDDKRQMWKKVISAQATCCVVPPHHNANTDSSEYNSYKCVWTAATPINPTQYMQQHHQPHRQHLCEYECGSIRNVWVCAIAVIYLPPIPDPCLDVHIPVQNL